MPPSATLEPLELLRARLEAVTKIDLPPPLPGPWEYGRDSHYFYHPREWTQGYVQAARDFLKAIDDVR